MEIRERFVTINGRGRQGRGYRRSESFLDFSSSSSSTASRTTAADYIGYAREGCGQTCGDSVDARKIEGEEGDMEKSVSRAKIDIASARDALT